MYFLGSSGLFLDSFHSRISRILLYRSTNTYYVLNPRACRTKTNELNQHDVPQTQSPQSFKGVLNPTTNYISAFFLQGVPILPAHGFAVNAERHFASFISKNSFSVYTCCPKTVGFWWLTLLFSNISIALARHRIPMTPMDPSF